jgi:hypothetical protein
VSKRSKRREQSQDLPTAADVRGILKEETPVPPVNPAPRPLPLSLADIRSDTLRMHANTAHTIADLEAWRAEIDSTIAFLRAHSRRHDPE